MPQEDKGMLTPGRLLGVSGFIIVTLIGVLWTINSNRLNALEEWRKQTDASRAERIVSIRTEIALTKERLQNLTEKVNDLRDEIHHLREDFDLHRKGPK